MLLKTNNKIESVVKTFKRGHFAISIIIVTILLIAEGVFLYKYFYTALTESNMLKEIKQQVVLEELEISKFKKLEAFSEKKQKGLQIDLDTLRNPFDTIK